MKKKMIAVVMTLALILSAVSATPSMTAYAKTKSPKLSKKKIVMMMGKTQKIKLKNVSQKVRWTVAKKQVVRITKKSGKYNNSIVIKGLKVGSTKVTAKCGKKKYKVKVTVKKEAAPSISTTQQVTTKVTEATTSKIADTTTAKEVETTTFREVEVTTFQEVETTSKEVGITTKEEIPEQTTENHTTEELTENFTTEEVTEQEQTTEESTAPETTTMEPTSEEPTIEMMTTEQLTEDISTSEEQTEHLTTEEETTQEETTEPETTRETKLVAEVLNDGLTTDDNLQIKYYFDGPTDVVLWTTGNSYTLEIYEENHWIELKLNPEWIPPIGMGGLSQDMPEILELPLSKIYLDFKPGHYRFTRPLGPHYTYKGENPFGNSISVEFDVTCPEFFVLGQVKQEQIRNTDNLEIAYTIITENEKEYTCSMEPYDLYVWSDELVRPMVWWPVYPVSSYDGTNREYETMIGSNTIEMTIPLKEYYGDLSPGLYKYMHKIGEKEIGVLFEIVAEEEIN